MELPSTPDISSLYQAMLTTKQAAKLLGVSPYFLYKDRTMTKHHTAPNIPYVKIGSSVRYRLTDLEDFVKNSTVGTKPNLAPVTN